MMYMRAMQLSKAFAMCVEDYLYHNRQMRGDVAISAAGPCQDLRVYNFWHSFFSDSCLSFGKSRESKAGPFKIIALRLKRAFIRCLYTLQTNIALALLVSAGGRATASGQPINSFYLRSTCILAITARSELEDVQDGVTALQSHP